MTVAGELPSPEARLRFTLGLDALVSVGGSLFALLVYIAAFRSGWLLVLSSVAALAAIKLYRSRQLLDAGRLGASLALFACANWMAALGVALVGTFAWPLMLLAAVLPAIVVVPHAEARQVRAYVVASLVVALGVTALGNLQDFTNFSDEAPEWAQQTVVAFFAPFLCALVVLTAWQNSTRLQTALEEQRRINTELVESRRRVVAATDRERQRIERDLHDGAQQRLVALTLHIRRLRNAIEGGTPKTREILDRMRSDVHAAQDELRSLVQGLFPPVLEQHGLPAALRSAADRSALHVTLDLAPVPRCAPDVEAAVYFCCLEALQNVAKHAPAADVALILAARDGQLEFRVSDNGGGFSTSGDAGLGLTNMRDRVAAAGGQLDVRSRSGAGVTVQGSVPARAAL